MKKLINVEANDDNIKLWKGVTTNLVNFDNPTYPWAVQIYNQMLEQNWIPDVVNLTQDALDYNTLTKEERNTFKKLTSYLNFLDSIQVMNLSHISEPMTAPEVSATIAHQTFQETLHVSAYKKLIDSVIPVDERKEVYYAWQNDKKLKERVLYISSLYQDYIDNKTEENYFYTLIANYLLEGMYFWNGFNFFHNLAFRNCMGGCESMIALIKRDELNHIRLFQKLIQEAKKTIPYSVDKVYQIVYDTTEQEIDWNNYILGNQIRGFSPQSNKQYLQQLANLRLTAIRCDKIYDISTKNPYSHLEASSDNSNEANTKSNYFESTVTSYDKPSAISGWDDI